MSEFDESWKDGKIHTAEDGSEVWYNNGRFVVTKHLTPDKDNNLTITLDHTKVEKDMQKELDEKNAQNAELKTQVSAILSDRADKTAQAMLNSRRGGGVVSLENEHKGRVGEYEDAGQAMKSLSTAKARQDWEGDRQYEEMKKLATQKVISHYLREGHQLSIVECVRCHGMIDMTKGNTCTRCGWSYNKEDV